MRKLVFAAAAISALLPTTISAAADPQTPTAVVCIASGKAMITPGLTVTPQAVTFTFSIEVNPCQMADGSIQSGTETGSASGALSCAGGHGSGLFTVAWNNGKTTSGTFSFASGGLLLGAFDNTDGQWAGTRGGFIAGLTSADLSACNSDGGLTEFSFAEMFSFAAP